MYASVEWPNSLIELSFQLSKYEAKDRVKNEFSSPVKKGRTAPVYEG